VKQNRRALREVGERAHADIETPLLSRLCDLAEYYGGAGKPSGAGGGDCGIAFMPTSEKAAEVMQAWEKNGIKPLALKLYTYVAISNEYRVSPLRKCGAILLFRRLFSYMRCACYNGMSKSFNLKTWMVKIAIIRASMSTIVIGVENIAKQQFRIRRILAWMLLCMWRALIFIYQIKQYGHQAHLVE